MPKLPLNGITATDAVRTGVREPGTGGWGPHWSGDAPGKRNATQPSGAALSLLLTVIS